MAAMKRALISVSDKSGLDVLGKALAEAGVEIISTGGTAKFLQSHGVAIKDISEHTGFPEMMDGRVKTLHPKVHGGLLAVRDNVEHVAAMEAHDIAAIDLVVVNLYPFEETVAKGASADQIIEQIDIGGPSMVRSAAKNHPHVAIVVDPADYEAVAKAVASGDMDKALLRKLAAKAFARTAAYDAAIAKWFETYVGSDDTLPETFAMQATKKQTLRYGENPHQQSALYRFAGDVDGIVGASQLQGKELSFNNIHDADAAFALATDLANSFDVPACAIIKHATPCGAAYGESMVDAYNRALASDPTSAFGGIIACTHAVDGVAAEAISQQFAEVIIAPAFDDAAKEIFAKKKNLRLLEIGAYPAARDDAWVKAIRGGVLVQTQDDNAMQPKEWKQVCGDAVTGDALDDALLAIVVCRHVRSNAIVLAKDAATVGIGGGQTSRVDAVRIALWHANEMDGKGKRSEGAVLASDAFFPFADNVELAAEAGVSTLVQPGGSVRDEEVVEAAKKHGMAMLMTGMRHFRH